MLEELEWTSLAERRQIQRLVLLYKTFNGEIAIELPEHIHKKTVPTRINHGNRYIEVATDSDAYRFSYFPRTIKDWNKLPPEATLTKTSSASFKTHLSQ